MNLIFDQTLDIDTINNYQKRMKRNEFIKTLALLPIICKTMEAKALNKRSEVLGNTERMPLLFLGHGSPMNAIEESVFVQGFRKVGKEIQKPKAIITKHQTLKSLQNRLKALPCLR